MTRTSRATFSSCCLGALALLASCGYVGDPLPPAGMLPAPVLDLRAIQNADQIEISFTLPEQTTEGLPITRPGQIDLRAGLPGEAPFDVNRWQSGARAVDAAWPVKPADQTTPTRIAAAIPAGPWVGKDLVIGVRLSNPRGRFAGFSRLHTISVVAPLAQPVVKTRAVAPQGVELTWDADLRAGVRYSVRRLDEGAAEPIVLGEASEGRWVDSAALFDKPYRYVVQATWKENDISATSLPSAPAAITPVDTFPPAAPTGLTALLGVTSIEIAWDRNTEPDLAGYRIYRAPAGGEFVRIAEVGSTPTYSDRQFARNATHRYAISAIDRRGNESPRSEPFEIEAR